LRQHGHDAEIAEGERSQFDVIADDRLVFSKQVEHRYPEVSEVLTSLTTDAR
jgi:hypothetical protein